MNALGTLTPTANLAIMVKSLPSSMPNIIGGSGGMVTSYANLLLPGAGAVTLECASSLFRAYVNNSANSSTQLLIKHLQATSRLNFRASWSF